MGVRENRRCFLLQMALPEISAMIDSQIDEREGKRMEVHQICSRNHFSLISFFQLSAKKGHAKQLVSRYFVTAPANLYVI